MPLGSFSTKEKQQQGKLGKDLYVSNVSKFGIKIIGFLYLQDSNLDDLQTSDGDVLTCER